MIQLAATPYTLHFRRPAPTSRGVLTERSLWLLRAWQHDAPEVAGWGECGPLPGLSRDEWPLYGDIVYDFCRAYNQASIVASATGPSVTPHLLEALPSLAFGVEMALRDLAQGGRRQLWETPFARGEAGLPTHGLIWMDDVEGILRQVAAKVAAGFGVIKLKVGALPFAEELALLHELRRAWPAVELRLDANGAFAPQDALDRLASLARFDVAFVEQPVRPGQRRVLADLCRHSPVPVALDEELIAIRTPAERERLLDEVRPHLLILKPALLGGFAVCEAWIAEARKRGIGWIANSLLESNIGLNAICQWTSAVGDGRVHGLGTGALFTDNVPSPLALQGNRLHLSSAQSWQWPV